MPKSEIKGREVDTRIAVEVMGWVRGPRWGNGNGEWIIDGKGYKEGSPTWDHTPRFSLNISDAMKVVKRLAEANVWTEIQVRGHGARPLVRMGVPSFQWDRYADSVDELPAAICAAALHKDALESIAGLRLIEAKGK